MTTYTALVIVDYHSGQLTTQVQIAADNSFMAKLLLESLYGQGRVLSVLAVSAT